MPVNVILFLSANPAGTARLDLDVELRTIDQEIQRAEWRKQFDLKSAPAAEWDDFRKKIEELHPVIVHFSGHGQSSGAGAEGERGSAEGAAASEARGSLVRPRPSSGEAPRPIAGRLVVRDKDGNAAPVSAETLGELFRVLGQSVRVVVLNACDTVAPAEAVAKHIGCVVGTSAEILDESAIAFAGAFYASLANGRSVQAAFDVGRTSIVLQSPEVVQLRRRDDVDPDTVVLAGPVEAPAGPSEPRRTPLPPLPAWPLALRPETEILRRELTTSRARLITVVARPGAGKTTLVTDVLSSLGAQTPPTSYVALEDHFKVPALFDAARALSKTAAESERLEPPAGQAPSPADTMAKIASSVQDGVLFVNGLEKAIDAKTGKLQSDMQEALEAYLDHDGPTFRIVAVGTDDAEDLKEAGAAGKRAPVPLELLPFGEMRRWLAKLFEHRCPWVLKEAGADTTLDGVTGLLGGLPRAAVMLADHLAQRKDSMLAGALEQHRGTLSGALLESLTQIVFEQMSANLQQVWQALAVYACPVPPAAVDDLLAPGGLALDSKKALSELADRGLVSFLDGRYAISSLDREAIAKTIPGHGTADKDEPGSFTWYGLHRAAADHFGGVIAAGGGVTCTKESAPAWLGKYRMLMDCGDVTGAAAALVQLGPYLAVTGQYPDAVRLCDELLARGPLTIPTWEATIASASGTAHLRSGDPKSALERYSRAQALIDAGARLDEERRFTVTESIGACKVLLGHIDEALQTFTAALAMATLPRIRRGCLTQVAYCHYLKGAAKDAVDRCKEALDPALDFAAEGEGPMSAAAEAQLQSTLYHTMAEAQMLSGEGDEDALESAEEGAKLADASRMPKVISENRAAMACANLFIDEPGDARDAARRALGLDAAQAAGAAVDWARVRFHPQNDHHAMAVLGAIELSSKNIDGAAAILRGAALQAARLRERNPDDVHTVATSILAGLALRHPLLPDSASDGVPSDMSALRDDHEKLAGAAPGLARLLGRLFERLLKSDVDGRFARRKRRVTGEPD